MARILQLLLFGLLTASAGAADFTGTYVGTSDGDRYTLTLEQKDDDLTGEAKGGEVTMKLKGKVSDDTASGAVALEGMEISFPFRMELREDRLTVKLAEPTELGAPNWAEADVILFTRTSAPPKDPKKYSKEPTEVLKNGKEYVHASGGKFKYPANWEIREQEGAVLLLPPDVGRDEIYAVVAERAEGATDATSPEVITYLDSQVKSLFPFVSRVGRVEKANAGNARGAALTWEGKKEGQDFRVRGYVTILKGYGVALVSAGPKAQLEKRDVVLRNIFQTLGWGQGRLDPQLVGAWSHWGYQSTGGGNGRETKAKVVLGKDGRFSYESSTETSMSGAVGSLASRRGSGWNGTWTADGSTLILNFEDGSSETFAYRFKDGFLIVTEEGGKPTEWSRG